MDAQRKLFGVVLAGGKSRRMGQDKALLPLGGYPLFQHCLDRLAPQVEEIAICANSSPERFAPWQGRILPDHFPDQGPVAALHAGLVWAENAGATHLVSAPCDMPFLPKDLVARFEGHDFAVAADLARIHPTLGLWPVHLLEALESSLGAQRLRLSDIARSLGATPVQIPTEALANLNTPEDLAAAEARWSCA